MWTEVLNEGGTESTTCRVAFVEIDNETERLIVILIGSSDCSNSKVKLNISRMCYYLRFICVFIVSPLRKTEKFNVIAEQG